MKAEHEALVAWYWQRKTGVLVAKPVSLRPVHKKFHMDSLGTEAGLPD